MKSEEGNCAGVIGNEKSSALPEACTCHEFQGKGENFPALPAAHPLFGILRKGRELSHFTSPLIRSVNLETREGIVLLDLPLFP